MVEETGVQRIAAERRRQIEVKGWTAEHDTEHGCCQLLDAAICYAGVAGSQVLDEDGGQEAMEGILEEWPWDRVWWKPSADPVRNLTKAGALIAAEIDRILYQRENGDE